MAMSRAPDNVKGAERTERSPLLVLATQAEVDRLAAWATARAAKMTTDLTLGRPDRAAALVRYYDLLCRPLGLDTVLAVCQTWHETATWSSWWFRSPRRNPAGIGVTGAVQDAPGSSGQWQPRPDGRWGKGHAYPTYASAAGAHVHGLAMWAGADADAVAALGARCKAAGVTPYTPPKVAQGSCTQWRHLGWAHNPRKIGWAYKGEQYGHAIAKLARQVLGQ